MCFRGLNCIRQVRGFLRGCGPGHTLAQEPAVPEDPNWSIAALVYPVTFCTLQPGLHALFHSPAVGICTFHILHHQASNCHERDSPGYAAAEPVWTETASLRGRLSCGPSKAHVKGTWSSGGAAAGNTCWDLYPSDHFNCGCCLQGACGYHLRPAARAPLQTAYLEAAQIRQFWQKASELS